jgi:putative membrane protein
MISGMGMMMWGALGSLLALLIFVLFLLAIAVAVRWLWRQSSTGTDSTVEVLKKRYARGEMSKDEYERIKAEIR